jgi:hypothetical protein
MTLHEERGVSPRMVVLRGESMLLPEQVTAMVRLHELGVGRSESHER